MAVFEKYSKEQVLKSILYSLETEIKRELTENALDIFGGAMLYFRVD